MPGIQDSIIRYKCYHCGSSLSATYAESKTSKICIECDATEIVPLPKLTVSGRGINPQLPSMPHESTVTPNLFHRLSTFIRNTNSAGRKKLKALNLRKIPAAISRFISTTNKPRTAAFVIVCLLGLLTIGLNYTHLTSKTDQRTSNPDEPDVAAANSVVNPGTGISLDANPLKKHPIPPPVVNSQDPNPPPQPAQHPQSNNTITVNKELLDALKN